jgi:pimeloyl-ACP methyl ester carboxylesterase
MHDPATGISMGEPYQAGKIPVLFIHGFTTSPESWLKMTNQLQRDPVLRERYQFWYAYYPSRAPLLFSAAKLRRGLADLRDSVDPGHSDPALDQLVLVGHSLGGVIGKQMIQSSGDTFDKNVLVTVSTDTRDTIAEALSFEPVPSVRRAIFICTPHLGSKTANQVVGRLASALLKRKNGEADSLHAEIVALHGPEVFISDDRERFTNGVDDLKYHSHILMTLSALPIAADVPYHSIIANFFPSTSPGQSWDGVVSYESAHIDGAASELIIRGPHTAHETPRAAEEVARILHLHLDSLLSPTNQSAAGNRWSVSDVHWMSRSSGGAARRALQGAARNDMLC